MPKGLVRQVCPQIRPGGPGSGSSAPRRSPFPCSHRPPKSIGSASVSYGRGGASDFALHCPRREAVVTASGGVVAAIWASGGGRERL